MLERKMVLPCTVYTLVQDEYVDFRSSTSITTTTWFREIDSYQHTSNREDFIAPQAMCWLRNSITVNPGDVITVEGKSYRILTVNVARRLGRSVAQFKKCGLERFDSFVS